MNNNQLSPYSKANTNGYILMTGPESASKPLLKLMAINALNQSINVISANHGFTPHQIARNVRRYSTKVNQALENIKIVRVFHSTQFLQALHQYENYPGSLFVMGGICLFFDEAIRFHHRKYIFFEYLNTLQKISQQRKVVIGIKPIPDSFEYPWNLLYQNAGRIFQVKQGEEEPFFHQPDLFTTQNNHLLV